jgi:hypothetical protein
LSCAFRKLTVYSAASAGKFFLSEYCKIVLRFATSFSFKLAKKLFFLFKVLSCGVSEGTGSEVNGL